MTLICLALALASVWLLYRILKRLEIQPGHIPWLLAAFVFGTGFWFSLTRTTGVAFYAHISSVFACLLCLNEAFGKKRGLLMGLFLGLAFLSRQLTLFMGPFLAAVIWTRQEQPPGQRLRNFIFFCLSLGACVLLYLFYNYIRFGNLFDTGYSYLQLGGFMHFRVKNYGLFHLRYLPFNFLYLFLQGPHFTFSGQELLQVTGMDMFGTAITFASPFVFFAFRGRLKRPLLVTAWISIGIMVLGHLLYYNNGWIQLNNQRFTLDYWPLLIVLVALGLEGVPARVWKSTILFAILLNALSVWVNIPPVAKSLFTS